MMIKVLHVCSYFNTSSLYKHLFEALSEFGISQEVFIPLYKKRDIAPKEYGTVRNYEKNTDKITYNYVKCLNNIERYFLIYRIHKLYRKIYPIVINQKPDILHGHSLFANGGICLLVKKKLKVDYIVAFRQTDLVIYNKLKIYRPLAKKIIKESKNIVFISYTLRDKLLSVCDNELKKIINEKGIVIPNGLPQKWFDIDKKERKIINGEIKFVYQGTFHKRKNIDYVIKLIEKLNEEKINASLKIIGGGPEKKNLKEQIEKSVYAHKFLLLKWSNDFETIKNRYLESSIFIMPSINETFGISYLEALACGLPIIYKKDDGIDGFFDNDKVGIAIECKNIEEDVKRIKELIKNYTEMSYNTAKVITRFNWKYISKNYIQLYK